MKLRENVSPRPVALKRRPLVFPVCFFMLGVWAGFRLLLHPLAVLIPALLFTGAVLVFSRFKWSLWFLLAACLCAGAFRASIVQGRPQIPVFQKQTETASVYMEVTGKIAGDPYLLYGRNSLRWRFPIFINQIRYANEQRPVRFAAWVTATADNACFHYGQTWRFLGSMRKLSEQYVHLSTSSRDAELIRPASPFSLQSWCYKGRRACADILSNGMQDYPEQEGVLRALLLGYRSALPERLNTLFASTGTLHVFAISGLHVGVMAVLLTVVLRMTGMSRRVWFVVLIPALFLYVVGTGMKSSALRAWVMASMFWIAPAVNRRADAVTALAVAGAFLAAWNPLQLLDPGFIMSFTVVGGILILYPLFSPWFVSPFFADPWRPGPLSILRGWSLRLLRYAGQLMAVSCAAWLAAAPLSALWFQRVSLAGLLGNIVVVPGAFLVVFTGCLSLLFGSIHLFFAGVFNAANVLFVDVLVAAVSGMAALPWGSMAVSPPQLISLFLWYSGLVAFAIPLRWAKSAALFSLCAALVYYGVTTDQECAYADVLNVGRGYAALITGEGGARLLVNSGPDQHADAVLNHIRREGVDHLDVLVLTVPLSAAARGTPQILDSVDVDELWVTGYTSTSAIFNRSVMAAKEREIPIRFLSPGEKGAIGNLVWEAMYPCKPANAANSREGSIVFRVASRGTSILFMGAAGKREEKKLLEQSVNPAATVLVAGRHGDRDTLCEPWLDAVRPFHIIFSAERYSRLGEPSEQLLQRLEKRNLNLWVTGRDGPLRIYFRKKRRRKETVIPVNSK